MIRLKRKQEDEQKKNEEEAKAEAEGGGDVQMETNTESSSAAPVEDGGQVKIFGLGRAKGKKGGKGRTKKRTPGEIRIQKDIAELDGGKIAVVTFPNPNDLTKFNVEVSPDTGYWKGAKYFFTFSIPPLYPHEPPKVHCETQIYHPNINTEGNVCLNILREDWKPVLDINAVIYGLCFLFYEPNPDDPLNREAADLYRNNRPQFERTVQRCLKGGYVGGITYPQLI